MPSIPKPVRKMAKAIKTAHRKLRENPVTTYGKAKGHHEIREEKKKPLRSVKGAAEFRLNQKHSKEDLSKAHSHMKKHGG